MKSGPATVSVLLPIALCLKYDTSTAFQFRTKTEYWRKEMSPYYRYQYKFVKCQFSVQYRCFLPVCFGAAIPVACGSIYKRFAQCLLTLGDSLVETQKDQSTQDIDAICRSWNAFHVCANSALAGCPGEAAAVWESLRQESRKTQFSGNLYAMCASRTTFPPSTVPAPQSPPTSDQTNQETLKGQTHHHSATLITLFPVCSTLLVLLRS